MPVIPMAPPLNATLPINLQWISVASTWFVARRMPPPSAPATPSDKSLYVTLI